MFVTAQDFKKPYLIPNLDQPEYTASFVDFVENYEKEFLLKVLGSYFSEAFITAIQATPPIDQRWLDIRDGAEYVELGGQRKYKWAGLKKVFIRLIYAAWLQDGYSLWTEVGEGVQNTENADTATPAYRITRAYSDGSNLMGNYPVCLDDWDAVDSRDTLYGFLEASGTTYDADVVGGGWSSFQEYLFNEWTCPGTTNAFGL